MSGEGVLPGGLLEVPTTEHGPALDETSSLREMKGEWGRGPAGGAHHRARPGSGRDQQSEGDEG